MKKSLVLLMLSVAFTLAMAQQSPGVAAQSAMSDQKLLLFRKFSLELKDDSQAQLLKFARTVRKLPIVFRDKLFIIQTFTCEEELKVKPYIGVVRGQIIIDFLQKNAGIPRKRCLIQDRGLNPYDKDCLGGSGANLYLRENWESERE